MKEDSFLKSDSFVYTLKCVLAAAVFLQPAYLFSFSFCCLFVHTSAKRAMGLFPFEDVFVAPIDTQSSYPLRVDQLTQVESVERLCLQQVSVCVFCSLSVCLASQPLYAAINR